MKMIKPLLISSVLLITSSSFTYAKGANGNAVQQNNTSVTCKPYTKMINGISVSVNNKCEATADKKYYCGIIRNPNLLKNLTILNGKCRVFL